MARPRRAQTGVATTPPNKTAADVSVPKSLAGLLKSENVQKRIKEVLGRKAPQFASSLLSLVNSNDKLMAADPQSVLAAAMTAAVLDLPINKELGFAHIIPYAGVAIFQMGAKGFVQLGLRTGQYSRMNAMCVNDGAFGGHDDVGEPIILWDKIDETEPAVGYVFSFKLVNGFSKVAYWTKAKVTAHAERYSQAYKNKKMDSPWYNNFDAMALKTVAKNTLSKWGILSIEMQTALKWDEGVKRTMDQQEPDYIDGEVVPEGPKALFAPPPTPTTERPPTEGGLDLKKEAKTPPQPPPLAPTPVTREELVAEVNALLEVTKASKIKKVSDAIKWKWDEGEALEALTIEQLAALKSMLKC